MKTNQSKFYKRIIISVFAVALILLPIKSSAEASNIVTEISNTRDFYIEKNEPPSTFEENIAMTAAGVFALSPLSPAEISGATIEEKAKSILSRAAVGENISDDEISELISAQKDGLFGGIDDTVYAVIALKTVGAVFNSQQAITAILEMQNDDGSFGDGDENDKILQTSRILPVITVFSTDNIVASAVGNSVTYLKSVQNDDGTFGDGSAFTLSNVIMALADTGEMPNSDGWKNLLSVLNKFKNDDGSYRNFISDEEVFDKNATAAALSALHTLGKNESPFRKLMQNGNLVEVTAGDYLPFFIGYGVAALLSAAFWIFIIAKKKETKTLEETKELI